ncbi:hypothetical protein P171DRAFT_51640 [Karstenula rhodostoma CBS 690.94]|uniref:Uncharacterized protein n=1 Tax=Karstenula rhodostoma CBS 690.94 TaxID=1392251 RepID=A0A9P4PHB2_9PLEO|nr:hypothetical protein P171DRAFT_51640 [Karstenula rhodostoma CBS 690.94]
MSTAALPALHLEATAPDTMDLHSEDGLGFDDGDVDIDIDLRSAGGVDDDESLRDAGIDAGQDPQAVPGDQDDFMADNEDLIEEDINEDVELDLYPHSAEHTNALEPSPPAGPEEDLIDYSDDEDAAVDGDTVATNAPQTDALDDPVIAAELGDKPGVNNLSRHGSQAGEDEIKSQHTTNTHDEQTDSVPLQAQDLHTTQQPGDDSAQPDEQSQPGIHDDVENSGQETHSSDHGTSAPTVFPTAAGIDKSSTGQAEQDDPDVNFHPVNVNFNGKDYWLFQRHDYEGSGDYLLEDDSFLKQPLNSVINACREALGALDVDVPGDFELGFCLDSLHQVELFEEHSTCAFFSLNDILRVYLQLYVQEGITDPEYFCISLVSRPRVSSLLAELSRAATEGIGYSGLDNLIASGQSLFSVHKSQSPTEYSFGEWEGDDVQEVSKVQDDPDVGEQVQHEEEQQENYEREDVHGSHEEQGSGDRDWQQESNHEHDPEPEPELTIDISEEQVTAATSASGNAVSGTTTASVSKDVEQPIIDTAGSEQNLQDPEENFLDYSDDEYDEDAPDDRAQASRIESISATVQGDDPSQAQDYVENVAQAEQQSEHPVEGSPGGQAASGVNALTEYEGNDYSYGEFDRQAYGEIYEEYEQDFPEDEEAEGYPGYDIAQANVEHTNHVGDGEQQSASHAGDLNVTAEFYVEEHGVVDDAFEGSDDFPEFGDTAAVPQQTVNHDAAEDELDYSDDEEDGVAGQALVAASAAADTVVTSSTEPRNLSPQGQKRTIDEVGNDVVDATTSTDAKRPRV